MKKLIVLTMMVLGGVVFAQDKNTKATIEVDGVCNMCKARIEKACIKTKGVKMAEWSVETHELKLIYDESKVDLKTIQQNIADVGHDTKEIKAKDEVYEKINACCHYRDDQVVKDHKN